MALHQHKDSFLTGLGLAQQCETRNAGTIIINRSSFAGERVPTAIVNMDAWYDAFDVKEGDKLYKPKEREQKSGSRLPRIDFNIIAGLRLGYFTDCTDNTGEVPRITRVRMFIRVNSCHSWQ